MDRLPGLIARQIDIDLERSNLHVRHAPTALGAGTRAEHSSSFIRRWPANDNNNRMPSTARRRQKHPEEEYEPRCECLQSGSRSQLSSGQRARTERSSKIYIDEIIRRDLHHGDLLLARHRFVSASCRSERSVGRDTHWKACCIARSRKARCSDCSLSRGSFDGSRRSKRCARETRLNGTTAVPTPIAARRPYRRTWPGHWAAPDFS